MSRLFWNIWNYKTDENYICQIGMACTLEKVLADAKSLVERLRDHDSAAEVLIEQTTSLNKRVEAMKQVIRRGLSLSTCEMFEVLLIFIANEMLLYITNWSQ